MKVKELIEQLKEYDEDAEVGYYNLDGFDSCDWESVGDTYQIYNKVILEGENK